MLFFMGDDLSYGLNTLGPLCLWQCLRLCVSSCPSVDLVLKGSKNRIIDAGGGHGDGGGGG